MYIFLAYYLLHFTVAADTCANEAGLSMVQTQARQRPVRLRLQGLPALKPWEVNRYVVANYHKSGVYLSGKLSLLVEVRKFWIKYEQVNSVPWPRYDAYMRDRGQAKAEIRDVAHM